MQVDIPIKVEYQTPATVPIGDVIDSLIAMRLLLEEGSYNLGHFVPGLTVEKVSINVRSISQESPLREILLVSLFLAFQKQLEAEVPAAIEKLIGIQISDQYDTIITVSALILVFYGAAFAKDLISEAATKSSLREQLDNLVSELADSIGSSPEIVRKKLDERYKPKGRLKVLTTSAVNFFRPSKSQDNAPIVFGERRIEPRLIADVPQEHIYNEATKLEKSRNFHAVALDLHAQDRDKDSSGWAAIPIGISNRRLKMKLVDGVTPDQIWNRNNVKGDITVKYRRVGMDFEPYELHLNRVVD